jgi:hypothetical protein
MPKVNRIAFSLSIDREQWLRFYAGHANIVRVIADSGKILQIPANSLRPFILQNGVHGRFEINYDQCYKLLSINRL